ncbi:MAG: hypothetical protein M3320_01155 [Actinomycetota bacterium]|nr:hypothetical protein [Actinomycetota bacterium]
MPLDGAPTPEWMSAVRRALAQEHTGDERWQHAVETLTSDEVNGVPHLMFLTSGDAAADFVMTCVPAVDSAIENANTETG